MVVFKYLSIYILINLEFTLFFFSIIITNSIKLTYYIDKYNNKYNKLLINLIFII